MNIDRGSQGTSLKSLFQGMAPEQIRLIECMVTKAPPDIELQAVNDDKLTIKSPLVIIPQHLTDQKYPCYIETEAYCSPSTKLEDDTPFVHDVCSASGHTCPKHYYKQSWICIHNHLNVGDNVYVLVFGGGKKYYVLDRVPPDKETLKQHHDRCPY